ncbi:MAG: hypothetical protein OXF96_07315 [Chloroflexi bacterium]|nr:hypothetical protein [Chloroflexota bacterium]
MSDAQQRAEQKFAADLAATALVRDAAYPRLRESDHRAWIAQTIRKHETALERPRRLSAGRFREPCHGMGQLDKKTPGLV